MTNLSNEHCFWRKSSRDFNGSNGNTKQITRNEATCVINPPYCKYHCKFLEFLRAKDIMKYSVFSLTEWSDSFSALKPWPSTGSFLVNFFCFECKARIAEEFAANY